jgi:subtilisin family serine protease
MSCRNLVMLIVMLTLPAPLIASVRASQTIPWGVYRIRACCNWDNNRTKHVDMRNGVYAGQGIIVAVIDSGAYYTNKSGHVQHHPDLNASIIGILCRGFSYNKGLDETEVLTDYDDMGGHGTGVAGVIAAADNDIGVIGVAPLAKLMVLKLEHPYKYPPYNLYAEKETVAAIDWAVHHGAQVISMSLGFPDNFTDLYAACKNAYNLGALLIAASGNDEGNFIEYPAAYNSVIAVGAVNETCQRPSFSNYGPKLEFVAPGTNINTTSFPNINYTTVNGTSFAAPHVAGVAAMIFSSKIDPAYDTDHDGEWQNFEVRQKLRDGVLDLGPKGRDNETGWGMVNAWWSSMRPHGDLNVDLKCYIDDVALVSALFGNYWYTPNPPVYSWALADVNIDNKIDILDVSRVCACFGKYDP